MDLSGELCLMSVATDVTEMVALRNQMRLLSSYLTDSIVFLQRQPNGWKHFVVVNGLEDKLGLDAASLEKVMDRGDFYHWIEKDERVGFYKLIMEHLNSGTPFEIDSAFTLPDGRNVRLHIKMDRVDDERSRIEYICMLRAI